MVGRIVRGGGGMARLATIGGHPMGGTPRLDPIIKGLTVLLHFSICEALSGVSQEQESQARLLVLALFR